MEKDLKLYLTIINFFETKIIPAEEDDEIISNAIILLSHYLANDNLIEIYSEIGIDVIDLSYNKREECNTILKQEFLVV